MGAPVPGLFACFVAAIVTPSAPPDTRTISVPAEAPTEVLRYFGLKGDVDLGALRTALVAVRAEVVQGPEGLGSQPGRWFLAVRAPVDLAVKDLERAVRRGKAKVEPLWWIAFSGRKGELNDVSGLGAGYTRRDFIVNMAGDVRWYEEDGDKSYLWCVGRKLDEEELIDRYRKLVTPLGGGALGEVRRELRVFPLEPPLDERALKRLVKELEGLVGVAEVRPAEDGTSIEVTTRLAHLTTALPGRPASSRSWDVTPVFRLLAE